MADEKAVGSRHAGWARLGSRSNGPIDRRVNVQSRTGALSMPRAARPRRDRWGNVRDERQDRDRLAERDDPIDELARVDLVALHRRAFRLTCDRDAAQDLVQDTLERAYRKLAHYRPGTDMRAWLACIMRNVWISNYRRQAGAPTMVSLDELEETGPDRHPGRPSASSDVEASVVDELSVASIHLAIDGLPPHLRQVVVLADVEETPYGAIAAALAVPTGTVASRLYRGRRHLQYVLRAQAEGGECLARAG
jgi:RNA polymerase sigma-70 factor (ECF subfamily)